MLWLLAMTRNATAGRFIMPKKSTVRRQLLAGIARSRSSRFGNSRL